MPPPSSSSVVGRDRERLTGGDVHRNARELRVRRAEVVVGGPGVEERAQLDRQRDGVPPHDACEVAADDELDRERLAVVEAEVEREQEAGDVARHRRVE
jgi:hypothetical protein